MIASERNRLVKSLNLLSSPVDGEVLAAGRAAHRLAEAAGGWEAVIVASRGASADHLWDWRKVAREILASERESAWERNFCWDLLRKWRGHVLTRRQEETLRHILSRCCGRATA